MSKLRLRRLLRERARELPRIAIVVSDGALIVAGTLQGDAYSWTRGLPPGVDPETPAGRLWRARGKTPVEIVRAMHLVLSGYRLCPLDRTTLPDLEAAADQRIRLRRIDMAETARLIGSYEDVICRIRQGLIGDPAVPIGNDALGQALGWVYAFRCAAGLPIVGE